MRLIEQFSIGGRVLIFIIRRIKDQINWKTEMNEN